MNCQKCGNVLLQNEQYCGKCGAPVSNLNSNVNNEQSFNYSNVNNSYGPTKYKLILNRKKSFVGSLISFDIYIDNEKVGQIKNGETVELQVSSGDHQISINGNNAVNITISGDTTADVVVFGSNNFGITNVSGQGNGYVENKIDNKFIEKNKSATNSLFVISSLLSIGSVIMLIIKGVFLKPWIYGFLLGYALVNIAGIKNIKSSNVEEYNLLLKKNILTIVICAISIIISAYATIYLT